MPKLLPGLNFIAGLNGETKETYRLNMQLLNQIKNLGLMLRRINIRQVEGSGFQEVPRRNSGDLRAKSDPRLILRCCSRSYPLGRYSKMCGGSPSETA